GVGEDFGGDAGRDDDHAVRVTDHDVTGPHGDACAGDRDVRLPRDVTAAKHCRMDGGVVGGNVQGGERGAVADGAIGDDAVRTALLCAEGEDVADRAGRGVAAGVDDQDFPRP